MAIVADHDDLLIFPVILVDVIENASRFRYFSKQKMNGKSTGAS